MRRLFGFSVIGVSLIASTCRGFEGGAPVEGAGDGHAGEQAEERQEGDAGNGAVSASMTTASGGLAPEESGEGGGGMRRTPSLGGAGEATSGGNFEERSDGGQGGIRETAGYGAGQGGILETGGYGGRSDQPERSLGPWEVPGLSLWLPAEMDAFESEQDDAAAGGGGGAGAGNTLSRRISRWMDASGNHNDAVAPALDRRPLLNEGGPNGHVALRFDRDPSILEVADSETMNFGMGPFAILIVARSNNSETPEPGLYCGCGALLSKVTVEFPFTGFAFFANFPGPFSDRKTMTRFAVQLQYADAFLLSNSNHLNDGRYRLYVVYRPAVGSVKIRINGADEGSAQIPLELDVSARGRPLVLGGWEASPFQGDLVEVVMVRGELGEKLGRLEAYLLEKYTKYALD